MSSVIENITTIQGFDPSATITRSVEKTSTESTLFYKGWRFSATHSTILDSAELEALTGRIAQRVLGLAAVEPCDHIDVDGCLLHLPPMLFGSDALVVSQLEEGNGGDGEEPRNVMFFNACDALCLWAHQHKESEGFASGAVLQVPYANAWAERNGVDTSAASANVSPVKKALKPWDWTFCSDYCFSWSSKQDEAASYFSDKFSMRGCSLLPQPGFALGARELSRRAVQPGGRFERAPTSGVDLSLLSATDQPILFFDETLMYQDDLEDCGEVVCSAKIRVMPRCFFVLARTFLRVDGAAVRVRDTRVFHLFGAAELHVEVSWREARAAELADLSAALRDPNALAQRLPDVAEREGVVRFFRVML